MEKAKKAKTSKKLGVDLESVSDAVFIMTLIRLSKELGRVPAAKDIERTEWAPPYTAYIIRFGTLEHALRIAGLAKSHARKGNYDLESCLEGLRALTDRLGYIPCPNEVIEYMPSLNIDDFDRYFGSFRAALIAAGLNPYANSCYEKKRIEILRLFAGFAKRVGREPVVEDLGQNNELPSYRACCYYFGDWDSLLGELEKFV